MKYHNVSIRTTLIILATIVYASNCSSSGYRPHKTNGYALLRVGESPPQTATNASKKEDPEEVNHDRKRLNYFSSSSIIINETTLKQPFPELLLAAPPPEVARFQLERNYLGLRLATGSSGSTLQGEEPRKNNNNAHNLQQGPYHELPYQDISVHDSTEILGHKVEGAAENSNSNSTPNQRSQGAKSQNSISNEPRESGSPNKLAIKSGIFLAYPRSSISRKATSENSIQIYRNLSATSRDAIVNTFPLTLRTQIAIADRYRRRLLHGYIRTEKSSLESYLGRSNRSNDTAGDGKAPGDIFKNVGSADSENVTLGFSDGEQAPGDVVRRMKRDVEEVLSSDTEKDTEERVMFRESESGDYRTKIRRKIKATSTPTSKEGSNGGVIVPIILIIFSLVELAVATLWIWQDKIFANKKPTPPAPGAPGAPGAPIAPGTPGTSGAPIAPGTPGAPIAPGTPGTPMGPGVPWRPGAQWAPGAPYAPGAQWAPGAPGGPWAPRPPGTSGAPWPPGGQGAPGAPWPPGVPQSPTAPGATGAPGSPLVPGIPIPPGVQVPPAPTAPTAKSANQKESPNRVKKKTVPKPKKPK